MVIAAAKKVYCYAILEKIRFIKTELRKNEKIYAYLQKRMETVLHAIKKLRSMLTLEKQKLKDAGYEYPTEKHKVSAKEVVGAMGAR